MRWDPMLRGFVTLGLTMALLGVFAAPALASASSFKAVIHEDFGRRASARTCVVVATGLRCDGDGPVQGYGTVSSQSSYAAGGLTGVRTLTFPDGSTLTLAETHTANAFPGNSHDAPGALQRPGAGRPNRDTFTWTVTGGTGAFAGATGSGTGFSVLAGDELIFSFAGSLDVP